MSVRKVLEVPNALLRKKAKPVKTVTKKELKIAYDMIDTMQYYGGVGLAANQIGILKRIIVVQPPGSLPAIYFNPEILMTFGKRKVTEGCLSVPGVRLEVERSLWIRFGGVNHEEEYKKLNATTHLSQILEHEVDHLNGILFMDHLKEHKN